MTRAESAPPAVAGIAGEFLCSGKNPRHPERCEDRAVLALPWAAAVIDGATDITGDVYEGRTGGWLAADALARFVYQAAASGALAAWDDQALVREANASLMALYRRLGIVALTDADAGRRFRAGMAIARATADGLRITSVALPGVRIDGLHCPMESAEPAHAFENLLAATRAALWRDPDLATMPVAEREEACRAMLIGGRAAAGAYAAAWARAEAVVRASVAGPAAQIEAAFATGLIGNRRSRSAADPLFGPAIDGYCGEQPPLWSALLPWGGFRSVELFSDGYVVPPPEVSIAAWEAHVRHMNDTDPHRIGPFPAVKGAVPGGHHDDRTIVILRDWAAPR